MQSNQSTLSNDTFKVIGTVEIDQEKQTAAMTVPSPSENSQLPSSQSCGLDVSCSDDDEVSEVVMYFMLVLIQNTWTPCKTFRSYGHFFCDFC